MVISHMSVKIVNQIKRSNQTRIKSIAEDPTIKESPPQDNLSESQQVKVWTICVEVCDGVGPECVEWDNVARIILTTFN